MKTSKKKAPLLPFTKRAPAEVSASKSARRARGLVRVELWIDPVIAATLEALRTKRNETSAQTVRAALLLLFQMQEGSTVPVRGFLLTKPLDIQTPPGLVKIQTSSTYGKTAADIITDAVARGVSSGMAAALSTNGRGAAKIQPTHLANGGTKGKCKRCGFVRCACLGGVKR